MKNRRKVRLVFLIVFGFIFFSTGMFAQKAFAEMELGFQPRVTVGWMDYTFDYDANNYVGGIGYKFGDNIPVIGIGATVFMKKFYLDTLFQHSAEGDSSISAGSFISYGRPPYYFPLDADGTFSGNVEFYHWNYSITLGYQLMKGLSLYVGYKRNESEFDLDLYSSIKLIDDGSFTGVPGMPIQFNYIGDFDLDYTADGPFLGATYGFAIGDRGVLTLNFAVAFLEGEIEQSGVYVETRTHEEEPRFDLSSSGDSIGMSYGIGWRSNITDSVGYFLAIKGYNYDFDADNSDQSDFEETVYSFSVGLSYAF